jgi:DNA transformation protein and related proteins
MSVSDTYIAFVLEQLGTSGPIKAKTMFGGVGLYRGGIFFGLIDDDVLYFKVDESTQREFQQAGSQPFRPFGSESYSMRYYEVPADVLEDGAMLAQWAEKAVAVARKSATAKAKNPRGRSS